MPDEYDEQSNCNESEQDEDEYRTDASCKKPVDAVELPRDELFDEKLRSIGSFENGNDNAMTKYDSFDNWPSVENPDDDEFAQTVKQQSSTHQGSSTTSQGFHRDKSNLEISNASTFKTSDVFSSSVNNLNRTNMDDSQQNHFPPSPSSDYSNSKKRGQMKFRSPSKSRKGREAQSPHNVQTFQAIQHPREDMRNEHYYYSFPPARNIRSSHELAQGVMGMPSSFNHQSHHHTSMADPYRFHHHASRVHTDQQNQGIGALDGFNPWNEYCENHGRHTSAYAATTHMNHHENNQDHCGDEMDLTPIPFMPDNDQYRM